MNDIDTVARTIYGEARGEPDDGKKAVANVVMNRVSLASQHEHFGDGTAEGACMVPWQFDCWNAADPNAQIINDVFDSDPVFSHCIAIATLAVNRELPDITNGATFYYRNGSKTPKWAEGKIPCASIGNHLFFKDIA